MHLLLKLQTRKTYKSIERRFTCEYKSSYLRCKYLHPSREVKRSLLSDSLLLQSTLGADTIVCLHQCLTQTFAQRRRTSFKKRTQPLESQYIGTDTAKFSSIIHSRRPLCVSFFCKYFEIQITRIEFLFDDDATQIFLEVQSSHNFFQPTTWTVKK